MITIVWRQAGGLLSWGRQLVGWGKQRMAAVTTRTAGCTTTMCLTHSDEEEWSEGQTNTLWLLARWLLKSTTAEACRAAGVGGGMKMPADSAGWIPATFNTKTETSVSFSIYIYTGIWSPSHADMMHKEHAHTHTHTQAKSMVNRSRHVLH